MSKKLGKVLLLAVSAALIVVDQVTKHLAVTVLRDGPARSVSVIPGLLEFRYLENTAAAMGLFRGLIWMVVPLSVLVAIGIIVVLFLYKDHTWASYTAFSLVLAGGVGNLIDRVVNVGPGGERFVVDFIHVEFFPYIFNFADCCITVGAVFLVIHFIIASRREKNLGRAEGNGRQ